MYFYFCCRRKEEFHTNKSGGDNNHCCQQGEHSCSNQAKRRRVRPWSSKENSRKRSSKSQHGKEAYPSSWEKPQSRESKDISYRYFPHLYQSCMQKEFLFDSGGCWIPIVEEIRKILKFKEESVVRSEENQPEILHINGVIYHWPLSKPYGTSCRETCP